MRKKKGSLFLWGGTLLLAAAFLLTLYNLWDGYRATEQSQHVLQALQASLSKPAIAEDDIPDYIRCPEMDMPTVEIDGRECIGVLRIPAISVELPVLSQWSYDALKVSPCRYAGSAYLDTLVIAAHNYPSHFGKLNELQIGDTLSFTDVDENVFYYQVVLLETLQPDATDEMVDSDCDLTLFTCTLGGKQRVTVRCIRFPDGQPVND